MSRGKDKPGPKKPEYEPTTDVDRIGYFIEELAEVLAAAGKTIRWGPTSYNPELPPEERETNIAWLKRELGDLRAGIERLPSVVGPWAPRSSSDFSPAHPLGYLCKAVGGPFVCASEIVEAYAVASARSYDAPSDAVKRTLWTALGATLPELSRAIDFAFAYVEQIEATQ